MKNKRGAIGFVARVILAILVVGIVAYIIFSSIGKSTTSIFEPIKKLVGIESKETGKAEASTTADECFVKRYYWSKNSAKIGENAEIILEGKGDCNDKAVSIDIFKDNFLNFDSKSTSFDAIFKETKIKFIWLPNEKGEFYFIFKFGTYTSPGSERLKVE